MRSDFIYPTWPVELVKDKVVWKLDDNSYENLDELYEYIEFEIQKIKKDPIWQMAREMFVNEEEDDAPFKMSPAELALFKLIFQRQYKESEVCSCTQYGKSLTFSRAVLARISAFPEDWIVVAPDTKRGKIILNYVIKATAGNDYFKNKLIGIDLGERSVLNRLLEEKSKLKLTFQIIGPKQKYSSISILSADGRRKQDMMDAIMGFGGKNVIFEEASLTEDEVESGVYRMMAGKGKDYFYLKIGNPFKRNHFLTSWRDREVMKIFIDYRIGLADGRYQPEFIKKALLKPQADTLYRAWFPMEDAIDKEGWMQLITEDELRNAVGEGEHLYTNKFGIDVKGSGGDWNVLIHRSWLVAEIVLKDQSKDNLGYAGRILVARDKVKKDTGELVEMFPDSIGVGYGLSQILADKASYVYPVVAGETADDEVRFYNRRSEMYWRLKEWILGGGKLKGEYDDWKELLVIKYRINHEKKIQIIPKEVLLKSDVPSPNVADALAYSFRLDEDYDEEEENDDRYARNRANYGKR